MDSLERPPGHAQGGGNLRNGGAQRTRSGYAVPRRITQARPRRNDMLEIGSRAPAFSVQDHEGRTVSLADLAGKWVVLWWYPKASTPG